MADLTLYHAAPSRSSVVRWMLEELGEPYDLHVLSLMKGEQQQPAYLAVNPMGKVPPAEQGLLAMGGPKINFQVRSSNESLLAWYRHIGYVQDDVVSLGRRLIPDA